MHCWTTDGRGLESLVRADREPPRRLGDNDVLIEVKATSLNYRDLLVAKGQYGGEYDPPIIPLSDMCGVVSSVGPEVNDIEVGDRVTNAPLPQWLEGPLNPQFIKGFVGGAGVDGVLAEEVIFPADALVTVPEFFSDAQGATLSVAALTAWAAVVTHGNVRPGDWVLTHGTGGVAVFALQIAKALGAKTIFTTGSTEKGETIQSLTDADVVLSYRDEDWPKQVRAATGTSGADIVVETVGAATLSGSIKAAAMGGRLGIIGTMGGLTADVNMFDLIRKQLTLRGIYMESVDELRKLVATMGHHQIKPHVGWVFPFEEARSAYEFLAAKQHLGKIVIEVSS